jgi:NAD(P)-dependent dehydrogenase (short-subunit alcohol dehydrogenase family)
MLQFTLYFPYKSNEELMTRLAGKVVLVTGSTTGIGEGIARMCIAEGARVMFHGLEEDLAIKLKAEYGEKCSYRILDLAIERNWSLLIEETVKQFGAIDCLVNNAASTKRADLSHLTLDTYTYINKVNAQAPLFLTKAAIDFFRLQGIRGSVLNIGSINAFCGERVLLPYAMSKGALTTLTTTLADDPQLWAHMRINQLNLDWVATENEIKLKLNEGAAADWYLHVPKELAPSGRLLSPKDIGEHALLYLSSDVLNGNVISVGQVPMTVRLNRGQNLFADNQKQMINPIVKKEEQVARAKL